MDVLRYFTIQAGYQLQYGFQLDKTIAIQVYLLALQGQVTKHVV
jgi:hypothetical protein